MTLAHLKTDLLTPISTHTPARGVTEQNLPVVTDDEDFYSHAREGRDERSESQV